ncbi:MAG: hypothetical protein LBT47_03100 [Deltaproteobacteria bacterium]|jgi:hypothetical protein|nr:hypothetical protein [Deltaproteobacteria bacterium]
MSVGSKLLEQLAKVNLGNLCYISDEYMTHLGCDSTGIDIKWTWVIHNQINLNIDPEVRFGNPESVYFAVTISDNPKVIRGNIFVDDKIINKIIKWIKLNKQALLDYLNLKLFIVDDILDNIKYI